MSLRQRHVAKLGEGVYDVLVVGGGINGAVAAAALSAKGAKVALVEQNDFAAGASSNSSNFAWGGIKYLESHDYLLVNKLCQGRNHLMRSYPDKVTELRFLVTIGRKFRWHPVPVFMGTILYWAMGRFFTRRPQYHTVKRLHQIEPGINIDDVAGGVEYSDCYFRDGDARFVYDFIRRAMRDGCIAANYVASSSANRLNDVWLTTASDKVSGDTFTIKSRVLLNACGPYADAYNELTAQATKYHHVLSKGVHLIVDKIADSNKVLTFFADDGRMFFVAPMGRKTCIGTTDTPTTSPQPAADADDVRFILDNVNRLFKLKTPLCGEDVIAVRCGVRPLVQEGQSEVADWVKLSRKHAIDVDDEARYLSIFGGKLTDCISVGDEVVDIIARLGVRMPCLERAWFGEPGNVTKTDFLRQAALMKLDLLTPPSLSEPLSERLWRRYGDTAFELLALIQQDSSQADVLIEGAEYIKCELELAARDEMIVKLEDFLRRRTRISMSLRREDIINAAGLKTACRILFGEQRAAEKLQEYIDSDAPVTENGYAASATST